MVKKSRQHSRKKIAMDSKNQYVRKFRIYPAFLYCRLDKWLKEMSRNGFHIVHSGLFFFWFECGKPEEREYFTYGLSTQEGKYSLSLRYPFLEKSYGVKKKKSKINSNEAKVYNTIEIDIDKIDPDNNVGYKELVTDRNRLYMHHFIRNISIITAVILIYVVLLLTL